MTNFTYIYFSPLTLSDFQAHYPQFSTADAQELLDYWLIDYNFNAQRFYRAQHEQYKDIVRREFRQAYGLSEEDTRDDRRTEDWERFYKDADIPKFEAKTEAEAQKVENVTHDISVRRFGVRRPLIPIRTLATIPLRQIELGGPPDHEVYAVWFDRIINNPSAIQKQLRQLPYQQYLLSDHWRQVRAAVLLSYKAVCQAEDCWYSGESWYGGNWESEIHVHHLSYKNKGNERYLDLTLLCRRHHDLWHTHTRNPQAPRVKIAGSPGLAGVAPTFSAMLAATD